MSAPINNRLVYTTPAITSLFNNTPLSDFANLSSVTMALSVTTAAMGTRLTCNNPNNCKVRYDWGYTPVIHYMIPAIIYPGMTASVVINPKNAPNYKHAD